MRKILVTDQWSLRIVFDRVKYRVQLGFYAADKYFYKMFLVMEFENVQYILFFQQICSMFMY